MLNCFEDKRSSESGRDVLSVDRLAVRREERRRCLILNCWRSSDEATVTTDIISGCVLSLTPADRSRSIASPQNPILNYIQAIHLIFWNSATKWRKIGRSVVIEKFMTTYRRSYKTVVCTAPKTLNTAGPIGVNFGWWGKWVPQNLSWVLYPLGVKIGSNDGF